MIDFLLLISGVVLGGAGYRAWAEAMHHAEYKAWTAEQTELLAEIKRQREIIAANIGK